MTKKTPHEEEEKSEKCPEKILKMGKPHFGGPMTRVPWDTLHSSSSQMS